ncbi:TlpA family protein disulfide reductase [Mucilaginibacter phyllosphaerae]|uniref:Peroxiredoxin n=1 Tax=Mucilaginibacter phyllosphaerae TaxID=1812349 RepID=A0A4Y8AED7_9SPHI|nr:thioredoxin family protein [Mucilaginibacter phyllosphaerae]MBB3970443.1 peroxiredoxin [Mucilaginibacter phyllosphaerae]TEW66940.1 redoxin domain-containing protein [Mucilaginibacter phyllosphaerae]GGH12918.1 hypothetical protein GCM10007352_20050 [Mucilaginibacter phyllosphaerae]
MKYCYLIVFALLISACSNTPKVDLTINAAGINNGTIILSQANESLLSQNFKDGAAHINKPISTAGYYNISIIDTEKPLASKISFEVYLENGSYTIQTKAGSADYPAITSSSKTQQQLSDYYVTEGRMAGKLNQNISTNLIYLDTREARSLPKKERSALIAKTRNYQIARRKMEPAILKAYLSQHPDNVVAAHIMNLQYLDEYPAEYNALLNKLTAQAKQTPDGQKVADKLSLLMKLLPGAEAPDITGVTPDGKDFDKRSIKKKLILVEFWAAKSDQSQRNHSKMLNGLIIGDSDKKQFEIVSVSIDSSEDVWKRALKLSNLTWPQVADFKGDSSPNVSNWKITTLPAYFLVDSKWRILKPNIDIIDVDQEVHDYLKIH